MKMEYKPPLISAPNLFYKAIRSRLKAQHAVVISGHALLIIGMWHSGLFWPSMNLDMRPQWLSFTTQGKNVSDRFIRRCAGTPRNLLEWKSVKENQLVMNGYIVDDFWGENTLRAIRHAHAEIKVSALFRHSPPLSTVWMERPGVVWALGEGERQLTTSQGVNPLYFTLLQCAKRKLEDSDQTRDE